MFRPFIVIRRNSNWYVVHDGDRYGPYESKDRAREDAIARLQLYERVGDVGEVSIDEPDDGTPVVYRSDKTK